MQRPDHPEFTDIEARVTAQDRLDLHFEHQDALTVQRGSLTLAESLCRASHARAVIGSQVLNGEILAVADDWVQLTTATVRLHQCEQIQAVGSGSHERSRLTFRQMVRQYAGRIPREVLMARGTSQVLVIEWVAADFLHARIEDRPVLVPLAQVVGILGSFSQ